LKLPGQDSNLDKESQNFLGRPIHGNRKTQENKRNSMNYKGFWRKNSTSALVKNSQVLPLFGNHLLGYCWANLMQTSRIANPKIVFTKATYRSCEMLPMDKRKSVMALFVGAGAARFIVRPAVGLGKK